MKGFSVLRAGSLPLLLALVVGGCARANVSTTVQDDGAFEREIVFAVNPGPMEPENVSVENVFRLPSGEGWSVEHSKTDSERQALCKRKFAAESTSEDIVVMAKGKALFSNSIRVTRLANGELEYRETLRWLGPAPKDVPVPTAEDVEKLRPFLPDTITDAEVVAFIEAVDRDVWRVMFGPSDPLLSQLLAHPDLALRKLQARIGGRVLFHLEDRFGDRLTAAQRQRIVRESLDLTKNRAGTARSAPPESAGEGSDPDSLVAMLFSVRLPGEIVRTNGETDVVTGEVYWALYPQAAAMGEVELIAVCRP
ncbi:MAG: hypothetical protein SNJ76_08620 [Fimbriimonadaceae bacterium]